MVRALTEAGLPAAEDGTSPHRFLYFPSENHWVLNPQHAKIWYQVVTAFLARHVLGDDVELPETLGKRRYARVRIAARYERGPERVGVEE